MKGRNPGVCVNCGKRSSERCNDDYCRDCHVSLSFDDCVSGVCVNCGKRSSERCNDDYCRECHVSLSFDDCVSGARVEQERRAAGLERKRARR
jgi:hypothetical protein